MEDFYERQAMEDELYLEYVQLLFLISSQESEEFDEPSPAPAQPTKDETPAYKMEFDVDEAFKV